MDKKSNELKDLRRFGIVLAGILAVFGTIHHIKHHLLPAHWFAEVGLVILCIGLLAPRLLKPIYAIFLKVAYAIGWFNTRVILIPIYYVILTPIALIVRISGKDLLNRKIEKTISSYWVTRPSDKILKQQFEKQF